MIKDAGKRGKFIVFEGLDGSGKTTQLKLLTDRLKLEAVPFYATAEPTNSTIGGIIRDTLNNNFKREPEELAALFLADRIYHNVNRNNGFGVFLDNGIHVICDRYYYSAFAYQGVDCDLRWLMDMNLKCRAIREPDLCLFMDLDTEKCMKRTSERLRKEIYEGDSGKINDIRERFYNIFKLVGHNVKIVDSDKPIDLLAKEIYGIVTDEMLKD